MLRPLSFCTGGTTRNFCGISRRTKASMISNRWIAR